MTGGLSGLATHHHLHQQHHIIIITIIDKKVLILFGPIKACKIALITISNTFARYSLISPMKIAIAIIESNSCNSFGLKLPTKFVCQSSIAWKLSLVVSSLAFVFVCVCICICIVCVCVCICICVCLYLYLYLCVIVKLVHKCSIVRKNQFGSFGLDQGFLHHT